MKKTVKIENECEGCPPFEDGLKSKEMCGWCELYNEG